MGVKRFGFPKKGRVVSKNKKPGLKGNRVFLFDPPGEKNIFPGPPGICGV